MKQIKRRLELEGQGAVMHVEDAVRCRDRWRIPVTFQCEAVRLEFAHFAAVKALGANFVVEECFSEDQMNAFFVEVPRTRLSGWSALTIGQKGLCIGAAATFVASVVGASLHVLPYFAL